MVWRRDPADSGSHASEAALWLREVIAALGDTALVRVREPVPGGALVVEVPGQGFIADVLPLHDRRAS